MTNPLLRVLPKYINSWFWAVGLCMESTCGHDPVEDNVSSSRIRLNHPTEFFCCQFLPLCNSCYHPWFLSTVVLGYLQWKHFPVLLSWGSVWAAPSLSGPDLVEPLLCQARVNKSFSVCLYAPGWWWGASHNHLLSHTGLVTVVTLSWGHSNPLRVISSAFLQCHCENCHLHLKCYEWRPFAFLPLTMYLKYWRVHKLFN